MAKKIDKFKRALRTGATALASATSLGGYLATQSKQEEISNMFFLKRWFANLFYHNDINALNQSNEHFAKALGLSASLMSGLAIDKATEKVFPKSKTARNLSQAVIYPTLALSSNALRNSAYEVTTSHETLNSPTDSGIEELVLKDSISRESYEFLRNIGNSIKHNAQDLYLTTQDALTNLTQISDSTDLETITKYGVAGLAVLALYKTALKPLIPLTKKVLKVGKDIATEPFRG